MSKLYIYSFDCIKIKILFLFKEINLLVYRIHLYIRIFLLLAEFIFLWLEDYKTDVPVSLLAVSQGLLSASRGHPQFPATWASHRPSCNMATYFFKAWKRVPRSANADSYITTEQNIILIQYLHSVSIITEIPYPMIHNHGHPITFAL